MSCTAISDILMYFDLEKADEGINKSEKYVKKILDKRIKLIDYKTIHITSNFIQKKETNINIDVEYIIYEIKFSLKLNQIFNNKRKIILGNKIFGLQRDIYAFPIITERNYIILPNGINSMNGYLKDNIIHFLYSLNWSKRNKFARISWKYFSKYISIIINNTPLLLFELFLPMKQYLLYKKI
jgi:hypothetical protein